MKKVSVVIPCYNAAGYLDKCIEQLLNQTIGIDNIEIILVDDASTDGEETRNLIRKYEEQFPNTVLAVFLAENMRQGGARNAGVFMQKVSILLFATRMTGCWKKHWNMHMIQQKNITQI